MNEPRSWNSALRKNPELTAIRSQLVSPAAQLFRILCQAAKPCGSGSRPRKSMYCWRTKNGTVAIGLVGVASLSVIVTVALEGALRLIPTGLLKAMVKL